VRRPTLVLSDPPCGTLSWILEYWRRRALEERNGERAMDGWSGEERPLDAAVEQKV
jgi:hypothetical protein